MPTSDRNVDREEKVNVHKFTTTNHRLCVVPLVLTVLFTLSLIQGCAPVAVDREAVIAPEPPPPSRPEARPIKPGIRFAWKPGRWEYAQKKKRYAWTPGQWVRIQQPYHHHWVPGQWRQVSQGYVWTEGHWR